VTPFNVVHKAMTLCKEKPFSAAMKQFGWMLLLTPQMAHMDKSWNQLCYYQRLKNSDDLIN